MPDGSVSAIDVRPDVELATPALTNEICPEPPPVVLVAVPPGVVTVIVPLVAPAGTVAAIWVAELTVNVADVPLKATTVAPVKFVPVIVTTVPGVPLDGLKPVMVGAGAAVTVKLVGLVAVPPGVVAEIVPLVAPVGTVAVT
jgi:hypothetical protein